MLKRRNLTKMDLQILQDEVRLMKKRREKKDYLQLMLNGDLILHLSYSNAEDGIYLFQNPWLADAATQHGIERCQAELKNNIKQILERTKEKYERFHKERPLDNKEFLEQISILERILGSDFQKILVFGLNEEKERLEAEIGPISLATQQLYLF